MMMDENTFWKIIDTTLEHSTLEDDIAYDEFLIKQLEKLKVQEIAQFQLRLFKLRKALDIFEINQVAQALEYHTSRETFNRFCNGIVASGKTFYDKAKAGKLQQEKNLLEFRYCYYEGFSLVAPAAFYEKKGLDADWEHALRNEKRILKLNRDKDQNLDPELEH